MKPAKKVKIEQVIKEPNNSSDQMTIEKAMYIGKTEGMALGIITLFQQDLIKKPAEQVVNVERLGLETSNIKQLDTIEAFIDLGLSEEKMVNVLSKYIRGDKSINTIFRFIRKY